MLVMWLSFSCHTMHQSLDTASCALCIPSNYFNSNVCVFELFQLAESWIIMSSYLLHLEMLKALFFPLPRSTWTAYASDVPIVSCVAWRFILNTSFILGSWEAWWKRRVLPNILHKCGCLLQTTGNGVWLFCLAHLSISGLILVAEASSTL